MQKWMTESQLIKPLDPIWRMRAKKHLAEQTRPQKSLGYLETVIEQVVAIQEIERPTFARKRILIFASDHGVEAEGVSCYPREVTKSMVTNFIQGGATINALSRQIGAEVFVIDVGVDGELSSEKQLIQAKIRRGTRNFVIEPAMNTSELDQALEVGWQMACRAKEDGIDLLALGEMGIGNTTAASAVVAALLEVKPELVTGRGTGIDDEMLAHKIKIIEQAIARHEGSLRDPLSVLQHLGGYEIAALTGSILSGARARLPMVVDGWVVASAVLIAARLNAHVLDYVFFGHQSEERGHRLVLESLRAKPLLDLSMRLGEASGAALAMVILDASIRIYNEVATFQEAGVSQRKEPNEVTLE